MLKYILQETAKLISRPEITCHNKPTQDEKLPGSQLYIHLQNSTFRIKSWHQDSFKFFIE